MTSGRGMATATAVGIDYCCEDPGHEGYCLHLGVVAYLDYLEVIAAEGYGYGAAYCYRPTYSEGKEKQKSA